MTQREMGSRWSQPSAERQSLGTALLFRFVVAAWLLGMFVLSYEGRAGGSRQPEELSEFDSDDEAYYALTKMPVQVAATLTKRDKGHTDSVRSVAISPDGKRLASGSLDNTIKLWDIPDRAWIAELPGHREGPIGLPRAVTCVAFSPDGKLLASGGRDNAVKLWDVASRSARSRFTEHEGDVLCVAFSPDGKLLASGSADRTIRLWDTGGGTHQYPNLLKGHESDVLSVAFSPDGKILASGSADRTIRLWDMDKKSSPVTLRGHRSKVHSVAFSPDGKVLASGSADETIRLWDIATDKCEILKGHYSAVLTVAFSPDGKLLASGTGDRPIKLWLWDMGTLRRIATREREKQHESSIESVAFSPGGDLLASGGGDKTIKLWVSRTTVCLGAERAFVNWMPGIPHAAPAAVAEANVDVHEGRAIRVKVKVRNDGIGSLFRFECRTSCQDVKEWDGKHLLFGNLVCKQQAMVRERLLPIPKALTTGQYTLRLIFEEMNKNQPEPVTFHLDVPALLRPNLAWAYEVIDDPSKGDPTKVVGNKDGVVQRGEAVDLVFTVKNNGQDTAKSARLAVALPKDPGLDVFDLTTFDLGDIAAESTVTKKVNVHVKLTCQLDAIPIKVTLTEKIFDLTKEEDRKVAFNTREAPVILVNNREMWVAVDEAVLRAGASDETQEVARAPKGTSLFVVGEYPRQEWYQVEVTLSEQEKQKLWVKGGQLTKQNPGGPPRGPVVVTKWQKYPPQIVFNSPSADMETTDHKLQVSVTVVDADGMLKDVKAEVGPDEASLRGIGGSVQKEERPQADKGDSRSLKYTCDLEEGRNIIRVTAVDDTGLTQSKSLTITRKRKEGRLHLVAVGINTYPGELALRCARQDAEAFHQLCTEFLPIRPEDAHIFLDGQATKRSLMRCFGDLRKKTKPEDTVFVFLAGHGWIEEDDEYFLPADADLQNLFASAIGMDEFSRILKMDAERVVVIADACYSGKIKLRGREHLFGKLGGKGRFLIGYEGKAQEDSDLGHGYLTYYFLAGVRKWDADLNRDGIITLQEAYHYAHSEIKSHRQGDLWIDNQGNIDIELRKK